MTQKRLIDEICENPIVTDIDLGNAFDEILNATVVKIWRGSSYVDMPDWLKSAFTGAMCRTASDTLKAIERLSIDGILPKRYIDFQNAHNSNNIIDSHSVVDLLILEYFKPGRIANGITLEDIKLYDSDLYEELEAYEMVYGPLPKELHIPRISEANSLASCKKWKRQKREPE